MPEREPQQEQVRPEFLAVLSLAQKTPQIIDDLWMASERYPTEWYSDSKKRLGELGIAGDSTEENWQFWLTNAESALIFLNHPDKYPPDLYQSLINMVPQNKVWIPKFDIPPGFKERKGIIESVTKNILGNKHRITLEGRRLPAIVIKKAQETGRVFPWQTAHFTNIFVRELKMQRIISKYIMVGGVKAYGLGYTPREDSESKIERLEYYQVSVIRGAKEYLFQMVAEDIEPHVETFERFLASMRSE